ncbi:unnamed protein product [Trichobilharzia szidati]|nr:unnamed protein product [Trichobilharzia szidati]
MTKTWQLCFTNILLLLILLFSFHISQLEGKTFVYKYTTNLSENSYKQVVLDVLSGSVYITPIILNEFNEKVDAINKSLWYVTLNIDTKTSTEEITLNSLVLFNPNGLIDRIFISRSTLKKGIIEINLFKGLLSLFNVNNKFEAGIEIDSSGKCQVTYATTTAVAVADKSPTTLTSDNIIIIDKEKTSCERLQKPIDVWNENSLPLFNFKESRQILTRYKCDKLTHQILEVYAYEKQIHAFIDDLSEANYKEYQQLINSTGVNLISWQELKFLEETIHQDDRIQKIVEKHYDFTLDEVIEILFGSDYQTIHLGLVYPISKSQTTCGLNLNLFTAIHSDSNEEGDANQKRDQMLFILRQHIESYRDHLQTDAIGSIQSTEALLNLTSLLRCLSTSNASISALTSATMLAPPAIEGRVIYRQINTWRDRLIDILISCGTDTCLTIVLNRLTALSQFIYSNEDEARGSENYNDKSLEIIKSKEMLYTKLWPSISHLRKLTSVHQMDQLYAMCEKSILIDDNYICLMTLINLLEHNTIAYDVRPIVQHIQKLLDITEFNVKNAPMKRNKLLAGLAMSKKLRHPGLTRSLFKIILDNSEKRIPVVLQTLAIRVIGEIHFSNEAKNRLKSYNDHDQQQHQQQLTEIRTRLIDILYKLPKDSQNDLLIGQEIFRVLLLSELPAASLAQILSDMAQQSRWSLIEICRQLIQQWCKMEMLTIGECQCLDWRQTTSTCQLGLSGSWSGLTGNTGEEEIGQATRLHNEISNLNNTLLIDYTTYFVLDPDGGLQLSDLSVSLVSKDGEAVIFDFGIQADKLTTLGGGTSSSGKSKDSDGNAWLNVDFSYLGISLLPQEVFSGGALDIVKFLWSASSSRLTPLLQVLKLPIDQRIQVSLTSGRIVQMDNLVGLALSISSSLEASVWRLSGKSLARTQIGLINEMKINLLQSYPSSSSQQQQQQQQHEEQSINLQLHQSLITKGFALQGNIDFTTEIDIKHLPDSICMTMDQGDNAYVLQWYLTNYSSASSPPSSYTTSPLVNITHHRGYHDKDVYYMSNYTLQPVTYFLGKDNSMKCRKMKV